MSVQNLRWSIIQVTKQPEYLFSLKKKNGSPAHILQSMLTLYRIAFAPARKSDQIGFLLKHIRTVISVRFL